MVDTMLEAPLDTDEADEDALMDHVALECMNAIEFKDKEAFKNSFMALIAYSLHEMSEEMEPEENQNG